MTDPGYGPSVARRRAEQRDGGASSTELNIPAGIRQYKFEQGTHEIDIIPYKVKRGQNEPGGNPNAYAGEIYFERTYYRYKKVGPARKPYICAARTFNERDFIDEWSRNQFAKFNDLSKEEQDYVKSFNPQERQLHIVFDKKHPEFGPQIMSTSTFCFGNLFDDRIRTVPEGSNWDYFYLPDHRGFTLRIVVKEDDSGKFKFDKAVSIDFMPRPAGFRFPDGVIGRIDLDDILVRTPYKTLQDLFMGTPPDNDEANTGSVDADGHPVSVAPSSKVNMAEYDAMFSTPTSAPAVVQQPVVQQPVVQQPVVQQPVVQQPVVQQPVVTAEFSAGQSVQWNNKTMTIVKVNPATDSVVLDDGDDNMMKVAIPELKAYQNRPKPVDTSNPAAFKIGQEIIVDGEKMTVMKVNAETQIVMFSDTKDDIVRKPFSHFTGAAPVTAAVKPAEPVVSKSPAPTAAQYGLEQGMQVSYQGLPCVISRISGDGTSMILLDQNNNSHTAVSPSDVLKITPKPATPAVVEQPKVTPAAATAPFVSNIDPAPAPGEKAWDTKWDPDE